MRCPNCYKRISDDCTFCNYCGTKIETEIICPSCGFSNGLNSSFCKKCGAPLAKTENVKSTKDPVKTTAKKVTNLTFAAVHKTFILQAFAMSFMLLSIILLFVGAFTPFASTSFFPPFDYTLIGWISNIFKTGIKKLAENNMYVDLVNCFVILLLLTVFVVVSIILLILGIKDFVIGMKNKLYFSFSKKVAFLFLMYVVLYVYFYKYALGLDRVYTNGIGGYPLFVFIFIPICIFFNAFVKWFDYKANNPDSRVLFVVISHLIAFVLVMVVFMMLGGDRFYLSPTVVLKNGAIFSEPSRYLGNLDLISYILSISNDLYDNALGPVLLATVNSGIAFLFEIILLVLYGVVLFTSTSVNLYKRPNYLYGLLVSIFGIVLMIIALILNNVAVSSLNQINSEIYGYIFKARFIGTSPLVTILIMSILVLGVNIAGIVLSKKRGIVNV